MMTSRCPSAPDLERAFFAGDDSVAQHVEACDKCSAEWDEIEMLSALAGSLPAPIDAAKKESLRTAVVSAPAPKAPRRWPVRTFGAVGASALAAGVMIAWMLTEPPASVVEDRPVAEARVTELEKSRFWIAGHQPDEIVRLVDGAISLDVDRLEPSARFRVVTGDAEVEVRGTTFDVVAKKDRLQHVAVLSGRVEVRVRGRHVATLDEGETWTVEPPKVLPVPEPKVKVKAKTKVETVALPVKPAEVEPEPRTETAFELGWAALQTKRFGEAADAFARAGADAATDAERADAQFFLGVALARDGDKGAALAAFERFLDDHPSSPRAAEVAAMAGWILYDEKEEARAEALFEKAAASNVPRVKKSGEDGLEAIRRNRARRGDSR